MSKSKKGVNLAGVDADVSDDSDVETTKSRETVSASGKGKSKAGKKKAWTKEVGESMWSKGKFKHVIGVDKSTANVFTCSKSTTKSVNGSSVKYNEFVSKLKANSFKHGLGLVAIGKYSTKSGRVPVSIFGLYNDVKAYLMKNEHIVSAWKTSNKGDTTGDDYDDFIVANGITAFDTDFLSPQEIKSKLEGYAAAESSAKKTKKCSTKEVRDRLENRTAQAKALSKLVKAANALFEKDKKQARADFTEKVAEQTKEEKNKSKRIAENFSEDAILKFIELAISAKPDVYNAHGVKREISKKGVSNLDDFIAKAKETASGNEKTYIGIDVSGHKYGNYKLRRSAKKEDDGGVPKFKKTVVIPIGKKSKLNSILGDAYLVTETEAVVDSVLKDLGYLGDTSSIKKGVEAALSQLKSEKEKKEEKQTTVTTLKLGKSTTSKSTSTKQQSTATTTQSGSESEDENA